MKTKEKKFIQGKPYDDKGSIYYKPAEKFAKFGTSGVRWLVKDAAKLLAKMPPKLSYYLSNGYKKLIDGKEVLAEDFIAPNIGAVIKSIALYNLQKAHGGHPVISGNKEEFEERLFKKGILLMYDNRPGNFGYAQEAAKIFAAYGIKTVFTKSDGRYVPTPLPAISRLVQVGGYAGSVNFTASHNGDEWNGIKFEVEDGRAADPKITNVIGTILAEELALKDTKKPVAYDIIEEDLEALIKSGKACTVDTLDFYAGEVSKYLDIDAIKKAITEGRVEFVYSAFFGSSGLMMIKLFQKLGLSTDKIIEADKSADQAYISSYEPTLKKLEKLTELVNARGREVAAKGAKTIIVGGAADNDADRFQVNQFNKAINRVDEFTPEKLSAILAHYLYKYRGFIGPVGRSFVSGSLLDEVAKLFDQKTIETATGFKFSPEVFIENNGIMFTEESYGISFKGWTLDKDGILPSLLALELISVTGKGLDEYYEGMLAELEKAGLPSKIYFKRFDMPLERELKEQAISKFTKFFNDIETDKTSFGNKIVSNRYDPNSYDGGMKFVMDDGSWLALRSSGTEPLIRLYIEGRGSEQDVENLHREALILMKLPVGELALAAQKISQKLHTPLKAATPEMAARFMKGGYNQGGYGVPDGAAIDGSFAIDNEGSQGYYVNGGKEIFLSTVADMRDFFERRARILGKPVKYVIKPGIGGQHTPFQGIASVFQATPAASGVVVGEYELGKDYEASIAPILKKMGIGWGEVIVIPSSKSGSTDETMMIFNDIFYILLKNIAGRDGLDGKLFADTVFGTMHNINFVDGKERPAKDLFKGFNLELVRKDLQSTGMKITYEQVKKVFGTVLGNMFFETTDRPEQSRLSAFIRNSGLDKELGENAPGFGAMFDNVGGRWTADLHMMTFLAYYKLDAKAYWNIRYEGIKDVRNGTHKANKLGGKIIDEGITDIALVVPDELFWFGKAMEQNFNESIWQKGFANLIAVKESSWAAQKSHYSKNKTAMVINISKIDIPAGSFNTVSLGALDFGQDKQGLAGSLGELFTTFYGMTHTVGNALIARAIEDKGFAISGLDLNDLDNPATKVFQQNLYLRQPYVELGKGLLEKRLKALQSGGYTAIEEELNKIKKSAKTQTVKQLTDIISKAIKDSKDSNRKFVPFIYLEGEKFIGLRELLVKLSIEWVMQGTGDQHISYQQVLAQPQRYMPFIISFVPEKTLPGRPAIGFAKSYLDNVSPNMVRDLFAEASYKALVEPRKNEAGEEMKGAFGIFLRMADSESDRSMLAEAFKISKNVVI